jgi:hypothetical protein
VQRSAVWSETLVRIPRVFRDDVISNHRKNFLAASFIKILTPLETAISALSRVRNWHAGSPFVSGSSDQDTSSLPREGRTNHETLICTENY